MASMALLLFIVIIPMAYASTIKQTMEAGMDIEITHPDTAVVGRTITISFLIKNNGWEDKQDVVFSFGPDSTITPKEKNEIRIEKISAGGSYGETIDFKIRPDASVGSHFLNLKYSQVLLANNEKPQWAGLK